MELSSTSPSCSLYAVTTATLIISLCVGIAARRPFNHRKLENISKRRARRVESTDSAV